MKSLDLIYLLLISLGAVNIASSLQETKECYDLKINHPNQLVEDQGVCVQLTENTSLHSNDSLLHPSNTCKCNLLDKEIFWQLLRSDKNERLLNSEHETQTNEKLELELQEEEEKERQLEIEKANESSAESDEDSDDEEDNLVEMLPLDDIDEEKALASDGGSRAKTDLQIVHTLQTCTCKSLIANLTRSTLTLKDFKKVLDVDCGSKVKFSSLAPDAYDRVRHHLGFSHMSYLKTLAENEWIELSNPGASGSGLYLTGDNRVILKTTQHRETEMLLKMLPRYYMRVSSHSNSLISAFLGQYKFSSHGQHITLLAMNNLLPTNIKMHQKYDLKGSTFGRTASERERAKKSPTFKDLDFMKHHRHGIFLDPAIYDLLMTAIDKDLEFLESFKIMDFSLLLGIHNLDAPDNDSSSFDSEFFNKISPWSAIPAYNQKGGRLLLFMGIIDVLQSYGIKKKLEHTYKSIIIDSHSISIQEPMIYSKRFKSFLADTVFRRG